MNSTMELSRLKEILGLFSNQKIAVVGDFFLDHYLILEENLNEISLETGKIAFQVVDQRLSPGAAGTIASILCSLDVQVFPIGFCGNDGSGYGLRMEMANRGMHLDHFYTFESKKTPTYIKPMLRREKNEEELNRMDVKNYSELLINEEDQIIEGINALVGEIDGLIIMDQVNRENMGVLTNRVREHLIRIGEKYLDLVIMTDSRTSIENFHHVGIKVNNFEARKAFSNDESETMEEIAQNMFENHTFGRPVVLTQGEKGILVYDKNGSNLISALKVKGPVDVVGAGDSVTASFTASLCSGADLCEAAFISNLTASLIVQQIGTTGIACQEDVINRYTDFFYKY